MPTSSEFHSPKTDATSEDLKAAWEEFAELARSSPDGVEVETSALLKYFGFQARGTHSNEVVWKNLREANLRMGPPHEEAGYYGAVLVAPALEGETDGVAESSGEAQAPQP